ncbi:MAG: HD-like signal output (HDOD) protein [Paraglaciecola sp.]|jgi:HD-like signal output (HDOD) protein
MNATQYAEKAGALFVLPEAVIKIKQLIDSGCASIADVADIIHYDPIMAAQIIKISNSALYNVPSVITTVNKAIQIIGTDSIYNLVLSLGISHAFKELDNEETDFSQYWEQTVSCGLLAKYLAQETSAKNPDKLFVCGLLHNIGELAVIKLDPLQAKRCSEFTHERSPLALQQQHLGFAYSDISTELLKAWGIPEEIYGPISKQHYSLTPPQSIDERVLQLARNLSLNNVFNDIYAPLDNIDKRQYQSLSLDKEDLECALDFTNMQLLNTLAIFRPCAFTIY